jgi:hypothetical protein
MKASQQSDLASGPKAPAHRQVGLDDVDAAQIKQSLKVPCGVERFAGGDRDRRTSAQSGISFKIKGWKWLLLPFNTVVRDTPHALERLIAGVVAVSVDDDARIIAKHLSGDRYADLSG